MKNRSLRKSFQHAFDGLIYVIKAERNMRIHIIIMFLIILLGFLLKIDITEWFICILLFGLVIAAECLNTAIEKMVDIFCPDKNELAKITKDSSAAFVLILAVTSAVMGIILFVPKLLEFI